MARRRHALVALAAFAAALALLLAVHASSEAHPPYPRERAVAAATRAPDVRATLAQSSWTEARVIALDDTHWRVTFNDGPRVLLDAAVGPAGTVDAVEKRLPGTHPPGSRILWTPALLVLLAALFLLAVAVQPLRSIRNLDAAVTGIGFTVAALLNDARLIELQVLAGAACLAYLAVRCAQVGFGAGERSVATPFYRRVFRGSGTPWLMKVVTAAVLLGGLVLTVASTGASDVAFAALAGATKLNHGDLPYGALTSDVVHGDTYPLLTYVLFMPVAAVAPVRDGFDSLDGALWLNAVALSAAAALIYRVAGRREPGTAAALAFLAFPPVLLAASGGGNDIPAAVFAVAALALFSRPALSSGALALAAWTKVVPGTALVVWLARLRGRALPASVAVAGAALVVGLLVIVAMGGAGGLRDASDAIRFQFERGSWYSVWQQTGTRGLQPVFQAATVAFAAVAAYEVWLRGPGGIGLRRAAALAGALLALLQIGANYWTYAYLPWLLPFILVALFPPVAAAAPQAPRRSPLRARRAP